MSGTARAGWARGVAAACVVLLALPFVLYAAGLGWTGLWQDLWPESRFDPPGQGLSAAVFLHMIAGAAITAIVPLQVLPGPRARWPWLHRWTGRAMVSLALITSAAGLVWIAAEGTIGGWQMSAAFALYGVLLAVAAVEAWRHARAGRFQRHRRWALRFAVLAMASWLYRVHYTLWYLATGGAGSAADFSGPFDRVQNLAFFVPYLILLELWFRRERHRGTGAVVTAS